MNTMENLFGIENGHEWVDLGLPSGTKWATCNVGASKPQDVGNHYAWGETTTKENYSWSTYLDGRITDYSDCGTDKDALKGVTNIAGKHYDIAGTQYDAAYANWGGKWRMPTYVQQIELRNQCYWVLTDSYNGSGYGYIVYKAKSLSDKGVMNLYEVTPSYTLSDAHIFLPHAFYLDEYGLFPGPYGGYWSSSRNIIFPYLARYLELSDNVHVYSHVHRYCGQSVRAVIPGE